MSWFIMIYVKVDYSKYLTYLYDFNYNIIYYNIFLCSINLEDAHVDN